jgi:tetratricopeptide (TPR) repeat protein
MLRFLSTLSLVGIWMLAHAGAAADLPTASQQGPRPPAASGQPAKQPLELIETPFRIEQQLTERLDTKYEKMLREAKERDDQLREQMSCLLTTTTYWTAILGLAITLLAIAGFREIYQIHKERKKVEELRHDLDRHIVGHIKTSIEAAWSGLGSQFEKLPPLGDKRRLAGSRPEAVSRENRLPYEETDTLVVLGDRLDALGGSDKATVYFSQLADFWWVVGDWARGAARSRRALEIGPTSYQAHLGYATGIMAQSSRLGSLEIKSKLLLLAEAERLLVRARQLRPGPDPSIQHKLGWIYDERGDFNKATEAYRVAMREAITPDSKARYGYDLACALAKTGRIEEALNELRPIIALQENWNLAQTDPDLQGLRQSQEHKDEFAALIEAGKKAATNNRIKNQ